MDMSAGDLAAEELAANDKVAEDLTADDMVQAALMLTADARRYCRRGVYQTKTRGTMARDCAKMEGKTRRCRQPNG
jgi:hypothetical protein